MDNICLFKIYSDHHNFDTRGKKDLHLLQPRLTIYQKGVYYMGIKTFNHLPSNIKDLSDDKKKFRTALKNYLLMNSFYSLEEFFNSKD
jgi:hypothetical protein